MPQMSRDTVTKRPAQRLAARAEAEGLRWLADGAHERSFVAEVVEASDEEIVTRRDPGDWIDDQLADIRAKAGARAA